MNQNTPDTAPDAAKLIPRSGGYEHYHIGITGQMEYLYGNEVETNPGLAIEILLAHVSHIARHYATKRHMAYEEAGAARLLALAGRDPMVQAELRQCEGMIARARKNLDILLGVPHEEEIIGIALEEAAGAAHEELVSVVTASINPVFSE